ncbi:MAG: MogA/MoaB family molybdenum cofactor biosynthesis protein [Actinobacteria bacterium]|nr:MogA/MoaB family molybdenum cofactor biosynthesis protein [Actinomycetota bacterium]
MTHSARVVTVSTRAADPELVGYQDTTGPVGAAMLTDLGFVVDQVVIVPDGPAVGSALRAAVADRIALVVTCGGTGIGVGDCTPEQTRAVLDVEVPGIAELVRARSWDAVPTAVLSRGISGVAGSTLIVNLPGSVSAIRECLTWIADVLPHACDQISGGDHVRSDHPK